MWFPIPGRIGYEASEDGEIADVRTREYKIKKQRPASNGAMRVEINGKTCMVHDLVAQAVYGRPPTKGYRVKHRNGNRADNRADNLLWAVTTGGSQPVQTSTHSTEFEQEYERIRLERLNLIDLMQS